jgi:DNA-binding response OmpR family regulator
VLLVCSYLLTGNTLLRLSDIQHGVALGHLTDHWSVEDTSPNPDALKASSRIQESKWPYAAADNRARKAGPDQAKTRRRLSNGNSMTLSKILLVDDDESIRLMMEEVLLQEGFDVTTAANVSEALKLISSNVYDVLLSDLHMPGTGDGLTVVSAMRHANPKAVTMTLSAFPEMDAASHAIMLQADQVLVKPMNVLALVSAIKERLTTGPPAAQVVETVATILERTTDSTVADWYGHIQKDKKVMTVPLTYEQRTCHLPQLFRELVHRLRSFKAIGSTESISSGAAEH